MSKSKSKKTNKTNYIVTPENKTSEIVNENVKTDSITENSEPVKTQVENSITNNESENTTVEPAIKEEETVDEVISNQTESQIQTEKVNVAATEFIFNEAEAPSKTNNKNIKKSLDTKRAVENTSQKNTLNGGIDNKTFFIKYAYFLGVLLVVFGILIYSVVLSRRSWINNLRTSVEKVLNESEPEMWAVGKVHNIENPFSLNCVCYETRYKKTGENYMAVLIRVSTLYGPLPAVFICNEQNEVTFVGYSSLHGRIAEQIKNHPSDKRITYWKKRIPEIIR